MPSKYPKVAIEFQASLKDGDKFTPIKDYAPHYGKVLTIDGLLRKYNNPDNCLYWVKDDAGNLDDVRCWWLRKCCTRVT